METRHDYEIAADELRAILNATGFEFVASPGLGTDDTEKGPQRFAFTLLKGQNEIRGDWTCGSAVALSAYRREPFKVSFPRGTLPGDIAIASHYQGRGLTILSAEIRQAIRRAYRPSLFDVVASLLSDVSCIDGYRDWIEWAADLGYLDGGADAVRKAQTDFATIQERAAILRRMLGADFDKALELSRRL